MTTLLVLDGSRPNDEHVTRVGEVLSSVLASMPISSKALRLSEMEIVACRGCFACWTRTPGECVIEDAGREVARAVTESDGVILLTPLVFGGPSSELKKAIDRLIPIISPLFRRVRGEVHHRARYASYPSLMGIGVRTSRLGTSKQDADLFQRLIARNAVNFLSPSHGAVVLDGDDDPTRMESTLREVLAGMGVS